MIVECQSCTTRFQLDDSRIPLAGIRVRCSKCKEAFFLEHPSATRAQAIDELAFDAAGNQSAPAPDSTQDLVTSSPNHVSEDDEDDWEFNHDAPAASAAGPIRDLARVADPSDSFSRSAASSGVSAAESSAATKAPDAVVPIDHDEARLNALHADEPFGTSPTNDEISFEDPEVDISGLDIEGFDDGDSDFDRSVTGDLAGSAHPDGSYRDVEATSQIAEPPLVNRSSGLPSLGKLASSAAAEGAGLLEADLEEPEDWDLLGEDLPAPPVLGLTREPRPAASIATTHMASPHAAKQAVSTRSTISNERGTFRLPGALRSAGTAAGWIVTASLLAATLWQGVTRSIAAAYAPATAQFEVGPLVARSVETAWVPTRDGRTLLSVRGELHNPTTSAQTPQLAVMVSLLDANGAPLDRPNLEAGRTIDIDTLRDLPATEREQLSVEASDALFAMSLAGGGSVPFAAYFSDVPVEARRVAVQGIERELLHDAGQDLPWSDPVRVLDPSEEQAAAGATSPTSGL